MRLTSYILAVALLGAPVAVRAAPAADARAQVQRARDGAQALRWQQSQLRSELNEVAGRIQELKAQQRGRLVPGGELSGLLRRSQELSGSLTDVESALARADGEVAQKSAALADALDSEMDSARAAFEKAGRDERRTLLERMRALRRERDQLRAQVPSGRVPQVTAAESDDPTDLLEQADALRDTQDKVAARLKALDRRLQELKRERELDRRMGEFLGEEQAFEERNRRLVGNGVPGLQDEARQVSGPFGTATADQIPPPTVAPAQAPAKDGPPQVGSGAAAPEGDDEIARLQKQRQELDAMSRELGARAGELEKRARELQ
ncbi:MAG TPA: TetR family transcriptional regulator [Myxococcales bacterium]|nr:TetR family transcriptional regulator [Myxococcales bacterium]